MNTRNVLLEILDLARWAPSGDNTQPWRFEILGADHIVVHGHDTREWCVYDYQGRASHIAHGALLETLRIAATMHKMAARWSCRSGVPDTSPVYDVYLEYNPELPADPLVPFIKSRTVQRRPMRFASLTGDQREAIGQALGAGYALHLFESFLDRCRVAGLLWKNAHIRLTCPEAYAVHKKIIEWGARYSIDRIPEGAVGVDPVTAKIMRWVMQSWERLEFFNRYFMGTVLPRVQLDLIPGLFCSAHFLIQAKKAPSELADYVRAGEVIQRVWLTCTANGLLLQPEMTPIIFNWYAVDGKALSCLSRVNQEVSVFSGKFQALTRPDKGYPVFMCRVGTSRQPGSRSVRKSLKELML